MSLLRSSRFGDLELRRCDETTPTCPFRRQEVDVDLEVRVRCLAIDRKDAAEDWLRAAVTHPGDMVTLRSLVLDLERPVAWLSSHQVVEKVAGMIARRDLCLLIPERLSVPARLRESAPPPPSSSGTTPSKLRPHVDDVRPPEVVRESELTDDVNQAMQAAALEAAARDGVPFCEVCEKARQQQAASAGSAA